MAVGTSANDPLATESAISASDVKVEAVPVILPTSEPNGVTLPPLFQCKFCLLYIESEHTRQLHQKRSHRFKCSVCLSSFTSNSQRVCHVYQVHPELSAGRSTVKICRFCEVPIFTNSYAAHCRNDHSHRCGSCHLVFHMRRYLFDHQVRDHLVTKVHSGQSQMRPAPAPPCRVKQMADDASRPKRRRKNMQQPPWKDETLPQKEPESQVNEEDLCPQVISFFLVSLNLILHDQSFATTYR